MTYQRFYGVSARYGMGLGRHVNHDDTSRRFAFRSSVPLVSTTWTRRIPVFDQGQLGSCTGNAAVGCLGTDPFYATVDDLPGSMVSPQWNEDQAVIVYSEATEIDPWPGTYPPQDTGSDGLSVSKVLQSHGWISGYLHAFTLDDALHALMRGPVITGTNWYDSMFAPLEDSEVGISTGSDIAGGHEYVVYAIDVERERVWCINSWGENWGTKGRFYMTWDTWGRLLDEDGDVTVFVPLDRQPPVPVPTVDQRLADSVRPWCTDRHVGDNRRAALAVQQWLRAKGL